jgi:hypothetical protein
MSNQDSLLSIVSDSYMTTDAYLKENDRASTSALLLAGGWIEGLYIGSTIANKNPKNTEIRTLMADQKYSLKNLIELLESYSGDQNVTSVLASLKDLNSVFDQVQEGQAKASDNGKEKASGTVTIGGDTELQLTDAQFKSIFEKVTKLRTSIINS